MTARIPQCSGDSVHTPTWRPARIRALDLKGNSIPRDRSPPLQRWAFLMTQPPFQRSEPQVRCWGTRASGAQEPWLPQPLIRAPALTVSTLSPALHVQAPCPCPLPPWGNSMSLTLPFLAPSPQTQGHFSSEWTPNDCSCASPFTCHLHPTPTPSSLHQVA